MIQLALMNMQRAERADLKHPRLLNEHGHGVALPKPHSSVRGGGEGEGLRGVPVFSQAGNQVLEQLRQMARAVSIAECNLGQVWNQIDLPQPFRDGRTSCRSSMDATLSISFILIFLRS